MNCVAEVGDDDGLQWSDEVSGSHEAQGTLLRMDSVPSSLLSPKKVA